ncbi:hypothetical protein GCM10010149_77610 [Nonomuraea roseoviolacea subsp. roseoviolacea]|uniref:CsbD family protein n=1 Tax=Nonomuraea roseoviolacea subsp. carminata TaxID=160689 RepID=A0ABT1K9K3_9ACTN|nr:hypothetical protein [Nonomuraea roseoviolacea]MCP2350690.1 hypothetical protein [Nonomuraea roseoviolacea subsp. carminata]
MTLSWEIGNKVKAFKGWARRLFGRSGAGRTGQVAGDPRQAGGKSEDAAKS